MQSRAGLISNNWLVFFGFSLPWDPTPALTSTYTTYLFAYLLPKHFIYIILSIIKENPYCSKMTNSDKWNWPVVWSTFLRLWRLVLGFLTPIVLVPFLLDFDDKVSLSILFKFKWFSFYWTIMIYVSSLDYVPMCSSLWWSFGCSNRSTSIWQVNLLYIPLVTIILFNFSANSRCTLSTVGHCFVRIFSFFCSFDEMINYHSLMSLFHRTDDTCIRYMKV